MAELGGMLASAILELVRVRIGSVIGGQITPQKDFIKELEKMKMTLESVEAVLKSVENADRRWIKDEPARLLLKRLTDTMYAISDTIDEFEAETTQLPVGKFSPKKIVAVMVPCLSKKIHIKKMNLLRKDLKTIISELRTFNLYGRELNVTDTWRTSSYMGVEQIVGYMGVEQIVGRTKEMDTILALLSESMTKQMLTIFPVYGIGGLGKTTLANMVYNSTQFRDYSRVWVYVSQTFDLKKIGNSIISQLSEKENETQYTGMQMIHNSLSELLSGKKILIVLDDLWEGEEFHLESLMDMLKVGKASNVVVIVTTRDEGIAKKISTIEPYKLSPLTDDMCWSIIKQKSAFESRDDKEQLEQTGKVIAMRCAGVALAAKSLGHMLHSMDTSEWESVRDSNIWNLLYSEDTISTQVLASLKLSFSVMPSYLKLCFAYCAIFPKGHKIVKDDLIHQWVSLGFSTWQLGERYIRQLLGLSFLEYSNLPSIAEDSGITLLTMHDLVHDLARSVLADEILVPGEHGNKGERVCRYALLDDCSKPLESFNIWALRFMDCCKIELHDAAFSSAMSLRVLDLSECFIRKLPDSIGLLKQLRYLNLSGCSRIEELSESLGHLKKLVHLDLSGCSRIEELSESLGHLKKLVHLDLSNCSSARDITKILGRLTKLQYLNLSHSSCILHCQEIECLGALTKLNYLNLSSKLSFLRKLPEAMGSFIDLRYLNLSGCHYLEELPKLFWNLKSLVHLDLSNCPKINGVPKALGGLTNLRYLNLSLTCHGVMPRLRGLTDVIGTLTNLRYLNLSRCISSILETYSDCSSKFQIDSLMYRISTLSNLGHLQLSGNDSVTSVPESLGNFKEEHALDLSHCRNIKKIHSSSVTIPCFVVHASDGKSSSNLALLQHMDPEELKVTSLENVKSAEEAESIKWTKNQRLEYLTLEWRRDAERFVDDKLLLEKLAPPSNLKRLEIRGYNSVSFPAWLMGKLPNLELLVLRGMESLEEWNTSCSSGEEYMIEELEIYDCPKLRMEQLPRAIKLKISNSDYLLSSWGECTISHDGASSSSSPVTTVLQVEYCQVSLQGWKLLHHLPGLTDLSISHCVELASSPEIIGHLSSLEILAVAAKDHEELPNWLGEITSLQQLKIVRYGSSKLHDNMRQLTKLQSLNLYGCNNIASLPHWLGELTSLKTLSIFGCEGIGSLPEGIQQLSNLQQLRILFCPLLKQWCESEENLTKLAHIKEKDIREHQQM